VALQGAGSLQDFGYQIGGIVARDSASAWDPQRLAAAGDVLRQAGQDDLDVVLNAGHLRLSQGRPQEALALFESARTLAPDHALVWLGIGLASFLNDDHTGAERAFRQSLAIDPLNRDARMNLAMVLDEQGKIAESLEQWRQLLAYPLRDEDRRQVELHIRELELQLSPGRD
jgi:cytochrome c-type biogenesis protein CcmH/NrfG